MSKYNKVTDMQVLAKMYEIQSRHYKIGIWLDYVSMNLIAKELKTSMYQIKKAYISLKEKGLISLEKVCTYSEEYDNGLYTTTNPILFTKVYMITAKGQEILESENDAK